jgi:predicted porin
MKSNALLTRASVVLLTSLTAWSVPASAQSNVSLSGMIDLGVFRDLSGDTQVGTIQRSNLTFKAVEDLGGGLKATAILSHRFDADTGRPEGAGAKPFWHGESTVGLSGAWGSLKAGRALDAMNTNDWAYDPWYNFDRVASPAWDLWHYNFPSDPTGNSGSPEFGRLNNGLFYVSPGFQGFNVHVSGSPGTPAAGSKRAVGLALNGKLSQFSFTVARERNSADATDLFLGGKWSAPSWAVMGARDVSKTAAGSQATSSTLGSQVYLGAWTWNLGWGQVDLDGIKAQKTASTGVVYALSKRTHVYADLARKSFPTEAHTVWGLGMSHSF